MKKNKSLRVEGQTERVILYAKRYSNKQDMYTGQPLIDTELSEWYIDRSRAKIARHLSNYQKQKAGKLPCLNTKQ